MSLIVSNWFAERKKLDIKTIEIEGVEFQRMTLTEDQKNDIQSCDSYTEMLDKAADYGLSYNRMRVVDDCDLAQDIDMFWEKDELNDGSDPSIRHQFGLVVCQVSGLTGHLDAQLELELEESKLINGDDLGDTSISLADLHADAAAANTRG